MQILDIHLRGAAGGLSRAAQPPSIVSSSIVRQGGFLAAELACFFSTSRV
jgi:hypothetical protein